MWQDSGGSSKVGGIPWSFEAQGYKTFFKLSSAEHEISVAHKC